MQQMIHKCCVLLGKKFGSFDRGFSACRLGSFGTDLLVYLMGVGVHCINNSGSVI